MRAQSNEDLSIAPADGEGSKSTAITCEVVTVNATVAKHLLDTTFFPRQRALNDRNVRRLCGEIKRGWYIRGTPLFFAVLPNGQMYLLNGRHSLTALIEADAVLQFTYIYHPVADMEEAGHLYSRLDLHRPRSWSDAYKATGFDRKAEFNSGWVNTFGTAIRTILMRFKTDDQVASWEVLQSREFQLRLFEDYLPIAELWVNALAHKNNKRATPWKRGGVMAVGLETFRWMPERAYDFWHAATQDDGLRKTDPRKMLHDYLLLIGATTQVDRRAIPYACAQCWNAYLAGDFTRTSLRVFPSNKFVLDGTPWDGDYAPFAKEMDQFVIGWDVGAASYTQFTTGTLLTKRGTEGVIEFVGSDKGGGRRPEDGS